MIERYEDGDLQVEYDDCSEDITIRIVSGGDLERLEIAWTAINYEPELYDRVADLFKRIAEHQRDNTEQYEITREDEEDD